MIYVDAKYYYYLVITNRFKQTSFRECNTVFKNNNL